jgi:hypothetical protein
MGQDQTLVGRSARNMNSNLEIYPIRDSSDAQWLLGLLKANGETGSLRC